MYHQQKGIKNLYGILGKLLMKESKGFTIAEKSVIHVIYLSHAVTQSTEAKPSYQVR